MSPGVDYRNVEIAPEPTGCKRFLTPTDRGEASGLRAHGRSLGEDGTGLHAPQGSRRRPGRPTFSWHSWRPWCSFPG